MAGVSQLSLRAYTHGAESEKQAFVTEFFAGLKEYGFVVLRDHPVPVALLHRAYELSRELFELPEPVKNAYQGREGRGQRGYTPFGREHAKNSKFPDLKEFWHVGRELSPVHPLADFFPTNVWPNGWNEFRDIFTRIFTAFDDTGRIMLEALTGPLEVEKNYFARMTDAGSSILRLLHYPPIPAGADPNCVRAAAHEDINLITLLPAASGGGLELLDRNGQWIPIDAAPDTLIVDSGDMLARITNECIPATTHRVVNPAGQNLSRYSMPFFMHPNPDARLTCLPSCRGGNAKYPDILANDFLVERLREIGLEK